MANQPLVLIVDHEFDFLNRISDKLNNSGLISIVAHNSFEAVDAAQKLKPDLVLTEIEIPGETGIDAALEIKQNPETAHLKVAFLSKLKNPWPQIAMHRDAIVQGIGIAGFIEKGENLDEIVFQIHGFLS
jgi:CheY-like chemotaxis protein